MINVKQWMDLPHEVRVKIIKDFNLEKTGRVGIANSIIISDGYTQNDILKININTLGELMDSSNENFDELFKEYTDLIQNSLTKVVEPVVEELPIIVDMNTVEEFNPNKALSGDTETYFGTKIKPITYKVHVKKETTKRK